VEALDLAAGLRMVRTGCSPSRNAIREVSWSKDPKEFIPRRWPLRADLDALDDDPDEVPAASRSPV
jgi:hypothetical protein